MTILARLTRLLRYTESERAQILQELADTKAALEAALGNDAADAEQIAAAQAAATEAQARAAEALAQVGTLQAAVDADVAEDAAIGDAIAPLEARIPADFEPIPGDEEPIPGDIA
jgi:hypothetical protein